MAAFAHSGDAGFARADGAAFAHARAGAGTGDSGGAARAGFEHRGFDHAFDGHERGERRDERGERRDERRAERFANGLNAYNSYAERYPFQYSPFNFCPPYDILDSGFAYDLDYCWHPIKAKVREDENKDIR
jgi:hypothetical protein